MTCPLPSQFPLTLLGSLYSRRPSQHGLRGAVPGQAVSPEWCTSCGAGHDGLAFHNGRQMDGGGVGTVACVSRLAGRAGSRYENGQREHTSTHKAQPSNRAQTFFRTPKGGRRQTGAMVLWPGAARAGSGTGDDGSGHHSPQWLSWILWSVN